LNFIKTYAEDKDASYNEIKDKKGIEGIKSIKKLEKIYNN